MCHVGSHWKTNYSAFLVWGRVLADSTTTAEKLWWKNPEHQTLSINTIKPFSPVCVQAVNQKKDQNVDVLDTLYILGIWSICLIWDIIRLFNWVNFMTRMFSVAPHAGHMKKTSSCEKNQWTKVNFYSSVTNTLKTKNHATLSLEKVIHSKSFIWNSFTGRCVWYEAERLNRAATELELWGVLKRKGNQSCNILAQTNYPNTHTHTH